MAVRKIENRNGRLAPTFCRRGMRTEIEVASLSSSRNDLLGIALDRVDHMIRKSRDLYADLTAGTLLRFKVIIRRWRSLDHFIAGVANAVAEFG